MLVSKYTQVVWLHFELECKSAALLRYNVLICLDDDMMLWYNVTICFNAKGFDRELVNKAFDVFQNNVTI